ncbi:MAG: DUF4177 domain-containing protein [Phycisphaerales bacterium]|nr:DUF4177 domain-containing protein [Phycisphaerales bacterium]
MDKWEYKLLDSKILPEAEKGIFKQPKVTLEEAETYLNKLGEEGWEIIDIDFDFLLHNTGAFVGVAKRKKA